MATQLLGGGRKEIAAAASLAFADAAGLRTFRHYPNTGARAAWASGDTASRAVWLALLVMRGEAGHGLVLTAPVFGFNDVFFRRQELAMKRPFGTYIIESVIFKARRMTDD